MYCTVLYICSQLISDTSMLHIIIKINNIKTLLRFQMIMKEEAFITFLNNLPLQ